MATTTAAATTNNGTTSPPAPGSTAPVPASCDLITDGPSLRAKNATPAIFFHDGGGTIFPYHCLGSLDRPLYGVPNPHYETGAPWPGGLDQMAESYAAAVRDAVSRDDFPNVATISGKRRKRVILGGWSLGGMLALAVSHILEGDRFLQVVGIVMVDSTYPVRLFSPPSSSSSSSSPHAPAGEQAAGQKKVVGSLQGRAGEVDESKLRRTEVLARQAMRAAGQMIRTWKLPSWEWDVVTTAGEDGAGAAAAAAAAQQVADTSNGVGARIPRVPDGPPPTILLKATEPVPMKDDDEVSPVDVWRGERDLGWSRYHVGFVGKVIEVEGDHFDLFSFKRLDATTEKVKEACDLLDR